MQTVVVCIQVVVYIILAVIIVTLILSMNYRNYLRRGILEIQPCPFGKTSYSVISTSGGRDDPEGIISTSLYGNVERYLGTLKDSIVNQGRYLPSWQYRVYVADNIPEVIRSDLKSLGAEISIMNRPIGHEGALWRFLPASQSKPFVSVDADDLFTKGTARQITEWLRSGKKYSLYHRYIFLMPMLAGRWGSLGNSVPDIQERMEKYCEYWFGFDEAFLKREIWPMVQYNHWSVTRMQFGRMLIIVIAILVVILVCIALGLIG